MPKRIPLPVGTKFGDWVVTGERISRRGVSCVPVRCSCGLEKIIEVSAARAGKTSRCKECSDKLHRKHNMSKLPEYGIWVKMLRRCYNPSCKSYCNYGKRGITVCDSWNPDKGGSFEQFYKDVGPRPSPLHQLDKDSIIRGNKIYGPGRVCWVTRHTNQMNRVNTIRVIFCEKETTLLELSKETKIDYHSLYWHVCLNKKTADEAVDFLLNKNRL